MTCAPLRRSVGTPRGPQHIAAEFARVRPNDGEVRFIAYGKDIHRSSDI